MEMKEICERYKKLYVAAVSDVLDSMGHWHQVMEIGLQPLDVRNCKIAGPAFTMMGMGSREMDKTKRLAVKAIDELYEYSVPVMTTNGDTRTGHWGELLSNAAIVHGCNGAVVDGGIRDCEAIDELGFPIFYKFTCPGDALGRFNIIDFECTIECAGVVVHPGDFIFGDRDGVVVVPKDLTEKVLIEAEGILEVENEIRQRIKNGEKVAELYTQYDQF